MAKPYDFKVGDYLVVTDVSAVEGGFEEEKSYEVTEVDSDGTPFVRLENGDEVGFFDYELKYVEKIKSRPTKRQLIKKLQVEFEGLRKRIDNLEEHSKKQDEIIAEQSEEIKDLKREIKVQVFNGRKEIILKAIKFIADHSKNINVVFEVDSKTKTVFAKKLQGNGGRYFVTATTSAVCGRHDIYNQFIGQAIALGRLVGADTSEFEDCVQPTDFIKGQTVSVLNMYGENHIGTVQKVEGDAVWLSVDGSVGYVYKDAETRYNVKGINPIIIDDTHAEY